MARTLALPLLVTVASVVIFGTGVPYASGASSITVEKSAYKNVVIEIRDNVPVDNCQTILQNLEVRNLNTHQQMDIHARVHQPAVHHGSVHPVHL